MLSNAGVLIKAPFQVDVNLFYLSFVVINIQLLAKGQNLQLLFTSFTMSGIIGKPEKREHTS